MKSAAVEPVRELAVSTGVVLFFIPGATRHGDSVSADSMRGLAALLAVVPVMAAANPSTVDLDPNGTVADEFRREVVSCASGTSQALKRAHAEAKRFLALYVRFIPGAVFKREVGAFLEAYARAARAYDTVGCCSPVSNLSVLALMERAHITDQYREQHELMALVLLPSDRLHSARAFVEGSHRGWRDGLLREAICAYRAAAALARRLGMGGQELRHAALAQRADEALLAADALRGRREPRLDDVALGCSAAPSRLRAIRAD